MPERIAQLSAAMAVGDSEAVDVFYREYFDWMYGQARRVTRRDESFCLDVVQDAVLRVIRTVKPVDEEGRFRGWLQLVVKTTAFDLLRSERRRRNREAMAGVLGTAVEPDVDSLQLDWLQDQINKLDPEIVKIIELRFEQSWTLRRIGERLGVSIGAVDGRLRRALTHMRLAAEELPDDPPPQAITETDPAAEPQNQLNGDPGTGAAAAVALDANLAEHVDVIAPPVAETGERVVDVELVAAAVEQAEAVLHDEPETRATAEASAELQRGTDADVGAPVVADTGEPIAEKTLPVLEVEPQPSLIVIQPAPIDIFPAVAARAVTADVDSDLREYAVAVNAVDLLEHPELVGLEDEAGWYDDWL